MRNLITFLFLGIHSMIIKPIKTIITITLYVGILVGIYQISFGQAIGTGYSKSNGSSYNLQDFIKNQTELFGENQECSPSAKMIHLNDGRTLGVLISVTLMVESSGWAIAGYSSTTEQIYCLRTTEIFIDKEQLLQKVDRILISEPKK